MHFCSLLYVLIVLKSSGFDNKCYEASVLKLFFILFEGKVYCQQSSKVKPRYRQGCL